MRLYLISYTARGRDTATRIAEVLANAGHICHTFALPKFCKAGDEPLTISADKWAETAFAEADGLIFCCAAGIAVRAIAPFVKNKTTDPAVIVADEFGRFIIPLLSGHLGGANELARWIAEGIGGTAVITTATDLNEVFAVDVFASKNHLYIEEMALSKEISAALLAGKTIGFYSELPWMGDLPDGLTAKMFEGLLPQANPSSECLAEKVAGPSRSVDFQSEFTKRVRPNHSAPDIWAEKNALAIPCLGICISPDPTKNPFKRTLHLVPKRFAVGIGCRRGKSEQELENFLMCQLSLCGISLKEIRCVASIDLKKDEPGLIALCKKYRLPFRTFLAEELSKVPGKFTESSFVKERTGVDSVCERAAVLASGGHLIRRKIAENGMTFALAVYEETIIFEKG